MSDPKPRDPLPLPSREPLPKLEPSSDIEISFTLTGWKAEAWRRYVAVVRRDPDPAAKTLTDSSIAAALVFAHLLRRETGIKDPTE